MPTPSTTQVPPPEPWVRSDGGPTLAFYKFIYNLYKSTPAAGVANGTIISNVSGTNAGPQANTLTTVFNALVSNSRGAIAVRGVSDWGGLSLGTTGKALVSNGTDLTYALVASLAATVTLASGSPAVITTAGGDLKLDSATHTLQLGTTFTGASVPANFSAAKVLAIKDGSGTTYYIPADTATW